MAEVEASVSKDESVLRDLQFQLKNARISLPKLSTLAQKGDEMLVEKFMTECVEVEGDDKAVKQSQLYIASFWGFHDVVKSLIDSGADVNKQNNGTLWTPLHAATFQEHGKVVMLLLERGAQAELPDAEGRTPADFGSASDKIWAHFASVGCHKTSRQNLVQKQIIKEGGATDAGNKQGLGSSSLGIGVKMAALLEPDFMVDRQDSFSRRNKRTNQDSSQMYAALGGDVLAGESDQGSSANANGTQPSFSVWRN
ncbi:serine/threonine-protein phosphatase 6 regulatory ankyrin repeat subunit B-like [Anneissia japonica]|uniref:serine/threonine-protein phosphatase 6 regulatory ankyrin repeat subunit B-like n=1 Tax=Anneissia japonica TaxID=1529436 RepID=UPI0014257602|nr:serine/threonine-protein phosphatase 6 regulatory ankyrin repeat subunit B-like [Anneissia japonica]